MPEIEFRRAGEQDIPDLVRLRLDFLAEVNREPNPAGLEASLYTYFEKYLSLGEFVGWLAIHDGAIVGTSALVFFNRPPSHSNPAGKQAYIINMYTLPEWRRRGLGRILLGHILDEARASGCGKAILHATEAGRPLYESFGFELETGEVEMGLRLRP